MESRQELGGLIVCQKPSENFWYNSIRRSKTLTSRAQGPCWQTERQENFPDMAKGVKSMER